MNLALKACHNDPWPSLNVQYTVDNHLSGSEII